MSDNLGSFTDKRDSTVFETVVSFHSSVQEKKDSSNVFLIDSWKGHLQSNNTHVSEVLAEAQLHTSSKLVIKKLGQTPWVWRAPEPKMTKEDL